MLYDLLAELLNKVKTYETVMPPSKHSLSSFAEWLAHDCPPALTEEPVWEGKVNGRSPDSVINSALVHLYRYAKIHAKAAIAGSGFATPDEFIYLISLSVHGQMTKSALIKMNIHDKSAGTQIINRLIANGLVEQTSIETDKRNRMINITPQGKLALEASMPNIRAATNNVTAPLSHHEKMELIRLVTKLEQHHETAMAERNPSPKNK